MSNSIEKLKELFSRFPTIGGRTASRFAFYILSLNQNDINNLVKAILEAKKNIKFCTFCFNPFEGHSGLCQICQNNSRNKSILCVVEKEADLSSIEKTKKYNGIYFILGGALNLRKNNLENLRVDDLVERLKNPLSFKLENANFKEIILALNPTSEGKSTSVLIEKSIGEITKSQNIKISHLAMGLPSGGELEYADDETLESAFEGRK
ncbi:MAG: recombination protein RecR [Candidatus Staskawiczbacteria bacterium]|nr:recombination protein RecR [Candidatus Staskawiczbacteria bacterium]